MNVFQFYRFGDFVISSYRFYDCKQPKTIVCQRSISLFSCLVFIALFFDSSFLFPNTNHQPTDCTYTQKKYITTKLLVFSTGLDLFNWKNVCFIISFSKWFYVRIFFCCVFSSLRFIFGSGTVNSHRLSHLSIRFLPSVGWWWSSFV
jgi:hypothetical protein